MKRALTVITFFENNLKVRAKSFNKSYLILQDTLHALEMCAMHAKCKQITFSVYLLYVLWNDNQYFNMLFNTYNLYVGFLLINNNNANASNK